MIGQISYSSAPKIFQSDTQNSKERALTEALCNLDLIAVNRGYGKPLQKNEIIQKFMAHYSTQDASFRENAKYLIEQAQFIAAGDKDKFLDTLTHPADKALFQFFWIAAQNRHSGYFAKSQTATIKTLLTEMAKADAKCASDKIISRIKTGPQANAVKTVPLEEQRKRILNQIAVLLKNENLNRFETQFLSGIHHCLRLKTTEFFLNYIVDNFDPKSLTIYDEYQQLLYLCAKLMRTLNWHTAEEDSHEKAKYSELVKILQNNPNNHLSKALTAIEDAWIDQDDSGFLNVSHDSDITPKTPQTYENKSTAFKLSDDELFSLIEPIPQGIYTNAPKTHENNEQKKQRLLARTMFFHQNMGLIDSAIGSQFKRTPGLGMSFVSEARKKASLSDDDEKNLEALANQYVQNENMKEVRVRCASVNTEDAAKHYLVTMLLKNANQVTGDVIHLIDVRYLDLMFPDGLPSAITPKESDIDRLNKHRQFINAALNGILTDNRIDSTKLDGMIQDLKNKELIPNNIECENLANKQVKFISLNFGPVAAEGLKEGTFFGALVSADKQSFNQLNQLYHIFKEKSEQGNTKNTYFNNLLKEFKDILDGNDLRTYLAGPKAFHLDEIVHQLCAACGFCTSSGCYSNKDRSSNFYMFHLIVQKIQEKSAKFISVKDFNLDGEEEQKIARKVIFENQVATLTLLNTGQPGGKCWRFNSWVKKAFSGIKNKPQDEDKAYRELQIKSKLVHN